MGARSTSKPALAIQQEQVVRLAHGGGGDVMRRLIDELIAPALGMVGESTLDCATLPVDGRSCTLTTAGFVVRPPVFPGGDIGRLAVCATVNKLASTGARPAALSLGLILEEGFALSDLRRLLMGAAEAAREVPVRIVVSDTKVAERGAVDGIFIHATAAGWSDGEPLHPRRARVGDAIVITGTLADHGIALLGLREQLELASGVHSDVAPLASLVLGLRLAGFELHAACAVGSGGLAAALHDLCAVASMSAVLEENALPVRPQVREACNLLGLDPLAVANQGNLALVLPATQAERAVQWLSGQPHGSEAAVIGAIVAQRRQRLLLRTRAGDERIVAMPLGEQLPRIS